jgi:hypothetical protein
MPGWTTAAYATRVVDEYKRATLTGEPERVSKKPLTLGELTELFLSAGGPNELITANLDNGADLDHDFYHGESDFYPKFDRSIHQLWLRTLPGASKRNMSRRSLE